MFDSTLHLKMLSDERRCEGRWTDWPVNTTVNYSRCRNHLPYTTWHFIHPHTRSKDNAHVSKCRCGVERLLSCYQSWLRGRRFPATLTSWPLDPISIKFLMSLWFIYSLLSLACHSTHPDEKRSLFIFIFGPDANKAMAEGFKRREERRRKTREERGWKHQGNDCGEVESVRCTPKGVKTGFGWRRQANRDTKR